MKLKNEIIALLRNPYIVASIIVALGLVIGVLLAPEKLWLALTAIGTLLVVTWAVFHEWILVKLNRPILALSLFEQEPPHIIEIPEISPETKKKSTGYYVTLMLINTGRLVAKSAQPQITAKAQYMYADGWKIQQNWIPVSIGWVLDEWIQMSEGRPTEERDMIPERPYLFHALGISSIQPHYLNIYPTIIPRHQSNQYVPGEYCFEIKVFAIGAKTIKKYVHVKWKQEEPDTFTSIPDRIEVTLRDDWPFQQEERG